jgi:hypothetical protein
MNSILRGQTVRLRTENEVGEQDLPGLAQMGQMLKDTPGPYRVLKVYPFEGRRDCLTLALLNGRTVSCSSRGMTRVMSSYWFIEV